MKNILVWSLLHVLPCVFLNSQEQSATIMVKNPLRIDRPNEMVSVNWRSIRKILPNLSAERIRIENQHSTDPIMHQVIDLNQDGTPEEVIFQTDLSARETRSFVIMSGEPMAAQSHTDARFVLPREDLAWENDRIAFRMYGPALAKDVNNGIDVWTKRVRHLIVAKWYKASEGSAPGRDSYHEDHGEGADFFSVGRTLGAGSSALWKSDSLYQPGVFASHKIISTGPLRAIFELSYNSVSYEGVSISEVKRISIDAGSNLNKFEVLYSGSRKGTTVAFGAGLVKRKGTESFVDSKSGWISLWGMTTDKEVDEFLGLGLIVPSKILFAVKEDKTHLLIVGQAKTGTWFTYYSGAGWTRSGDFADAGEWNRYLSTFVDRVRSPVTVEVRKSK